MNTYKIQFCGNTFTYILFEANYFDSGNISFWQQIDSAAYLKCLQNRNKKIINNINKTNK